jgi:hypothetical protein
VWSWLGRFRRDSLRKESLYKEPWVTPIMKCPSCGETLLYGVTVCRYCSAPIDQQSAFQNAVHFTFVASPCSLANNIRTGRAGILIVLTIDASIYLAGYSPLFLIWPIFVSFIGGGAVLRWRWRYGDLKLPDLEFCETQEMMKRELHLWLAVVSLQVIALVVHFLAA